MCERLYCETEKTTNSSNMVITLNHELWNDAVKYGALVVQRLSLLAHALFPGAERPKIVGRLGDGFPKETHDDASATGRSFNFNIEEDLARDFLQFAAEKKKIVSFEKDWHARTRQSQQIGSSRTRKRSRKRTRRQE